MPELVPLQPVDYLAVGHVAVDVTPEGNQLGGTAAYAALTALALGLRVGVFTSAAANAPLHDLDGIQVISIPSEFSTTYENQISEGRRSQILHHQAARISFEQIPAVWKNSPIIHLAPIAQELDGQLPKQMSASLVGITPQGWMRTWDEHGRVTACAWQGSQVALRHAEAVVISLEDVRHDLELVEMMAHQTRILCLTEGAAGVVLYWNGDRRRFRPPAVKEVDATGAGDIFAAAFFIRLSATRDPWEAARFANQLASFSVTRPGLSGIPTRREIQDCLMEVLS